MILHVDSIAIVLTEAVYHYQHRGGGESSKVIKPMLASPAEQPKSGPETVSSPT